MSISGTVLKAFKMIDISDSACVGWAWVTSLARRVKLVASPCRGLAALCDVGRKIEVAGTKQIYF